MPCLRGIEVFLTTKPDDERIPEYPHHDGAYARILENTRGSPNRRTGPTVSVYIPSIPATPFAVNYNVNNAPLAPCKYIFFRLYMNGRPIAAWGIDPKARPSGKVVKSLWAPCALYDDQVGFEGRNFVFLPGQEHKSVAEDGGLIEIQVFRAKERRARAPRVEEFRFQDNYGIAAPSIGLLDQPQDACFYDWHLLDAKDAPFASFRLHYRSLKNLQELNLIPATELELLCSLSPKALRSIAEANHSSKGSDNGSEPPSYRSRTSDEAVFHDCGENLAAGEQGRDGATQYSLKTPPELFPAVPASFRVPQPSKALRDASGESYLQRPLPELPVEEPRRFSRPSSVGSAGSATFSITPSLLQEVEEGRLYSGDVEVGIARLVQLPPSNSTLSTNPDDEPHPADYSISDYDASSNSATDSFSDAKLSPGRYLPTTGSVLERGIALFSSPKKTTSPEASISRQSSPCDFYSKQDLFPLERMTLSESEWINRSPSPARMRAATLAARRDDSPGTDRGGGGSLFARLRKKSFKGSPRKLLGEVLGHDVPKSGERGNAVQRGMGDRN